MGKKRIIIIVIESLFLISVIIFALTYMSGPPRLTGFTIFESQPDAATGNDTYIRENSDTNYGTETVFKVGKTAAGADFKSLIHFETSSISSGDTVTSGKIEVYLAASNTVNDITIKAYRVTSEWIEAEAGWNNRSTLVEWSAAGADYFATELDSVVFGDTVGWFNFTITEAAAGWVNQTYDNYGIILISDDAANNDYKEVSSSDESDSSLRPRIIIDHTENAAPTINNLSTDSTLSDPIDRGEDITFTINWSDAEGDTAKVYVCNSSDITIAGGCGDTELCTTSLASTNPIECSYTILTTDNRTKFFWAAVCDSDNCSTINDSYFYMNHFPNVSIIQPNGGETIDQDEGDYLIKFNVSDADSDSLTASIYYSTTQGATTNPIEENLNLLSQYCTDSDSTTSTQNNCTYNWDSTGVYGTYFLTIIVNDSFIISNDTSDSSFSVVSLVDTSAPNITAQWIDNLIYSGRYIQIYANITELNIDSAWVSVNTTPHTNVTMLNITETGVTYNATYRVEEVGEYEFKAFAKDLIGNLNNSMPWKTFNVSKPTASPQNESAPSSSLPYHTIKVTAQLNATDSLRDVYANLNTPPDFTFLSGYDQNTLLGNFSENETKTGTWYISTPMTEATHGLNVTYTDYYSNIWNSSTFNIEISSSLGGYYVSVEGYPEVETTGNYFAEAYFTKDGVYSTPDSILIYIYDALGNTIVGPVTLTNNPSTGIYNYTYTVGASATEGQWKTFINATKNAVSYYANQFWKVVGGPFDVRDIVVNDAIVNDLQISVTTENTGGANKDLILTWNLTRVDTNAVLDTGSDTFMVEANSEKIWTVNPSTSYIGQVKITFLGYYSSTEKAGAYKTFTTLESGVSPPGPGGGGGGGAVTEKKVAITIQNFEKLVYLSKTIEKTISVQVNNTGEKTLTNIILSLESLDKSYYSITPASLSSLKPGKVADFEIKLLVTDFIGEKEFQYLASSTEATKKEEAKIIVLNIEAYFLKEIERLRRKIASLREQTDDDKTLSDIATCEDILDRTSSEVEKGEFINAQNSIIKAEDCIDAAEDKLKGIREVPIIKIKMTDYWFWIITWILIILLIAILIFIIYILNKKLGIMNFFRKQDQETKEQTRGMKKQYIDKKIQNIEKKLQE